MIYHRRFDKVIINEPWTVKTQRLVKTLAGMVLEAPEKFPQNEDESVQWFKRQYPRSMRDFFQNSGKMFDEKTFRELLHEDRKHYGEAQR